MKRSRPEEDNGVELSGLRFDDSKATAEWLAKVMCLEKREEKKGMTPSQMEGIFEGVSSDQGELRELQRNLWDNREQHYKTLKEKLGGIWDVAMSDIDIHHNGAQYTATWDPDSHLMERLRENLGLGEEDTADYQRQFHASRDQPDVAIAWRVLCTAYEALHRKEVDCFRETYPNGDEFTSPILVPQQIRDTALMVAQGQALAHLDPDNESTGINPHYQEGSFPALHYQKQLLTMTIMEDENGSLLRPPIEDENGSLLRPGIGDAFLRDAVFGAGPWYDLSHIEGFRDRKRWEDAKRRLLELPKKVIDNMCPALCGKRENHQGEDLVHLRNCLYDFLRLLPWRDEYGLQLDE